MFITSTLPRIVAVAALATAIGSATASADKCLGIDINVRNGKTVKIKALSMEYKFTSDNTWRTEGFSNVEVPAGALKLVAADQTLATGEGLKLKAVKLHFQAWCGGKWSKEFVTQEDTEFGNTAPCGKGRTYEITVPFSKICEQIP